MPEYLQRTLGVSPKEAGSMLGIILLTASFLGQGLYAIVVDKFAARGVLDAPLRIGLLPTALAVPLAWFSFEAETASSFYMLLFAFALVTAPFNAINNTVAQQVSPPALRSRISALMVFSISIVGFAIAPALVGWLSEFVLGEARLGEAMQGVATLAMAGTLIFYGLARRPLLDAMGRQ